MSYDDENLDFNKIDKELDAAVEADKRYYRENDAKFRAVHQKVATYDEFRDIVLASHIKPLEKGDRISECKMTQPWNTVANKEIPVNYDKNTENQTQQNSNRIPKTSQEFGKHWKKSLKTLDEKYKYLIDIGGEKLTKIFHAEISFGLLGDIIQALTMYRLDEMSCVVDILDKLTTINRFSLSVQFLSSKEKVVCKQLFEKLLKDSADDETIQDKLKCMDTLYEICDQK
ncbi:coiled-coil domain-containing protein 103 [Patella vulgata]|uniref:coiled-coil domain-containing protein 103 n=1 Tax=Patella vulgata TaxID=6465 RepID=UPI00217F37D6|nr:coiled-coil domain-containing protein 103 [Patella vulgata]